ncbi:MAG TPA: hypothetical protein VJV78_01060 [Polyangiales bacterium]|nr:hypothetical protein [Polyangiales bacterium]
MSVDGQAGDAAPVPDAGADAHSSDPDASLHDSGPPPAADAAAPKDAEPPAEHKDAEPPAQREDAAAQDSAVEPNPDPDPDPPASQPRACAALHASGNVLLELGHGTQVNRLRQSTSRIASQDLTGHWVLWNAQTHEMITSGQVGCPAEEPSCGTSHGIELEGDVLAVPLGHSIELRSAGTGQLLTTVTTDSVWFGLAVDGSYLWAATTSALSAWSVNGVPLFTRAGNYASAQIFAAPTELRVGGGPVGSEYIERVSLNGTPSTPPAFAGVFRAWFSDGERFITRADTVARIYSKTSEQLAILAMPTAQNSVGGSGEYFWFSSSSKLSMYRLGQSTPVLDHSPEQSNVWLDVFAMRSVVLMREGPAVTLIDLAGSTPDTRELASPSPNAIEAFAAADAVHWSLSAGFGVLFDGAQPDSDDKPSVMNCGAVQSVAGAANGRVSVAVGAGQILHIALAARTIERVLPFSSSRVALTQDGSLLAAEGYASDGRLRVYDMPAGTEHGVFPGTSPSLPTAWELARGGQRIAGIVGNSSTGTKHIIVSDSRGKNLYDVDTGSNAVVIARLSPDGTRMAYAVQFQTTAQILHDGVLEGAATGVPIGWLDDTQLLLQKHNIQNPLRPTFLGSVIVDRLGNTTATPALPEIAGLPLGALPDASTKDAATIVNASELYIAGTNAIYDAHTGDVSWQGPASPTGVKMGAVADNFVTYYQGAAVYVEAR